MEPLGVALLLVFAVILQAERLVFVGTLLRLLAKSKSKSERRELIKHINKLIKRKV